MIDSLEFLVTLLQVNLIFGSSGPLGNLTDLFSFTTIH